MSSNLRLMAAASDAELRVTRGPCWSAQGLDDVVLPSCRPDGGLVNKNVASTLAAMPRVTKASIVASSEDTMSHKRSVLWPPRAPPPFAREHACVWEGATE